MISQIMIDGDHEEIDINFRNDIRSKKNVNYIINLNYEGKSDTNPKLIFADSNSTGGTTDPFEEVPFIKNKN